jgi:hypothetical protein
MEGHRWRQLVAIAIGGSGIGLFGFHWLLSQEADKSCLCGAPAIPVANPMPLVAVSQFGKAPMRSTVFCGSPDGRFYVTGDDKNRNVGEPNPVYLWDAKTGTLLRLIDGNLSGVEAAAFSPVGASSGHDDSAAE